MVMCTLTTLLRRMAARIGAGIISEGREHNRLPGWNAVWEGGRLPDDSRGKKPPRGTRTYFIGCDLRKDHDYVCLESAINRLGEIFPCFHSTWLVSTEVNASGIREYLSGFLEEGDKLFVVLCGPVASWAGFDPKFNEWLTNRL